MFKNYIQVAIRNLIRQKTYTLINCFGLAITLTVCIFIFLYIHDETSYDSNYKDANNIYRVIGKTDNDYFGRVSLPMEELKKSYSEILSYSRLYEENGIIRQGENEIKEKITYVDPGFVKVFSLPFLFGDSKSALTDKHYVVLSKSIAQKLFGNDNPVGKEIQIQLGRELKPFLISGVTNAVPGNSSINYSILIPFSNSAESTLGFFANRSLGISNLDASLFIKLRENVSMDRIQKAINKTMAGLLIPQLKDKLKFIFQPIKNIHLSTGVAFSIQPSSDPIYSYILTGIGLLILILASVNFINLTLMRSSHRFKEIGIRKIIGASRTKIFFQFMFEAFILAFISLIIAFALTDFLLPVFNQLTDKNLSFNYYKSSATFCSILILTVLLAVVTGFYPAVFMSKFNAVNVLKGNQKVSEKKLWGRLMIFSQFFVSVSLLICTVIMSRQFSYIQNKNLGFDKDNIVILNNDIINGPNFYNTFKYELIKYDNIRSVSCSDGMPGDLPSYEWNFKSGKSMVHANMFFVDSDYLITLRMKIKEGRNFSDKISSDTVNSVIVNEAFVKAMNTNNPIGSIIYAPMFEGKPLRIIGVVKDYNFSSLKYNIEPVVLTALNMPFRKYIIAKLGNGDIFSTMNMIESRWKSLSKDSPFSFTFLDDHLNSLYKSEKRWNDIIKYSGIFAILIALLGILGLTSFSIEKRIKEIGIRRILGADSTAIVKLFLNEFTSLVLLANILAWPIVWYYAKYWLQSFAFKTKIDFTSFIIVSSAVLFLTVLIISAQVYKAVNVNPTKTLRYE